MKSCVASPAVTWGAERRGHTLETTALVNEVYIRLVDVARVRWEDRAHFFAMSSQLMRRILVDAARARDSVKRWGPAELTEFGLGSHARRQIDSDAAARARLGQGGCAAQHGHQARIVVDRRTMDSRHAIWRGLSGCVAGPVDSAG